MKQLYSKYLCQLIFFTLLSGLFSCTPAPEDTVKEYLESTFLDNNGKKAYKLLSSDDQKYKSEKDFITDIKRKNVFNEKMLNKYKEQFSYEILDVKYIGQDTALVKVSMTKPNTQNILQEMLTFAMTASLSTLSQNEKKEIIQDQFGRIMGSEDLELETEEKEFMLLKEQGEYKIFFNYGQPYKMELINQKISELEKKAEECLRVIDYQGALKTYRQMLSLKNDEFIRMKIEEIEEIQKNTVALGNSATLGNLTFSPQKIEVRKIKISRRNWLGNSPKISLSEERYLVLTFQVKNNTDGEVLEFDDERRYRKEHTVYDNYGNEMKEFDWEFDMESVEDYKSKKLGPGETREVRAVCESPLSGKAEKFLWKVKLYTDNKKTENYAYIKFNKGEISSVEKPTPDLQ
ncbi:MAG: hypothetical protein K2X86_13255 [Cytophagaceae bacterium]|nr:hypothetical protein [Cytophagaceae bacterium]